MRLNFTAIATALATLAAPATAAAQTAAVTSPFSTISGVGHDTDTVQRMRSLLHGWATVAKQCRSPSDFYSGAEIGAVEAYDALSAPAEFMSFDFNGQTCASIVMWTKWKLRIK